jgi:transmembrane sensor
MFESPTIPHTDPLLTEAASWLIRLQSTNASEDEVSAWLQWCSADAAHLDAFERIQRFSDGLRELPISQRDEFLCLAEPAESTPSHRRTSTRKRAAIALAAGITVAAVLTLTMREAGLSEQEFSTVKGTGQEVTLADNSYVALGAASKVIMQYSSTRRHVVLAGGEAYFEVHHDRKRPFTVVAGPLTITAVGTRFDVRRTRQRTIVSVTEGVVDVVPEGGTVPVRMLAGQRAVEENDSQRLTVSNIDPQTALGWQRGRLQYVEEPLGSVVEDINRYAKHPITLTHDSLRTLTYTGTVFGDHTAEWAHALSTIFPVRVTTDIDGQISISPAAMR